MREDVFTYAVIAGALCLVILSLSGCAIEFSTDGKKHSLKTSFTPTAADYKGIIPFFDPGYGGDPTKKQ